MEISATKSQRFASLDPVTENNLSFKNQRYTSRYWTSAKSQIFWPHFKISIGWASVFALNVVCVPMESRIHAWMKFGRTYSLPLEYISNRTRVLRIEDERLKHYSLDLERWKMERLKDWNMKGERWTTGRPARRPGVRICSHCRISASHKSILVDPYQQKSLEFFLGEGPRSQGASWGVCGSGVPPYDFLNLYGVS
jgi:hypothetical protein